jgi:hypothetical protein
MEVLVFKTNIRYKKQLNAIQQHISEHPGILKWNIDLKDCDKVLRIESKNIEPVMIENIV